MTSLPSSAAAFDTIDSVSSANGSKSSRIWEATGTTTETDDLAGTDVEGAEKIRFEEII